MTHRAVAPVIGVVILVAMTVTLAAGVLIIVGDMVPPDPPPAVVFEGTVDVAEAEFSILHQQGQDLQMEHVGLSISVDDQPLAHQPPVPFFAATGFASGPTGPFNPAATDTWTAGERGTIQLASTNEPLPNENSTVVVEVSYQEYVIGTVELTHR